MEKTGKKKLTDIFIIILPGLLAFAVNCFAYMVPKQVVSPERYIFFDMEIDRMIPLVPAFIIIYYLSFAQWLNYFLQACFGKRDLRDRFFSADILAKIISFFVFMIWPVAMYSVTLPDDGSFWTKLLALTYAVDNRMGCLPSFHCFYSWMAFRYSLEAEPRERKWLTWANLIFAVLVFASTVLVKQHYLIDILAGVGFAEIALQLIGHTGLPERFGKAMDALTAKITERLA
ncbi:MAG: phosphatase PAP2 family protein [Erysipelotrichaceae bacterium]|nr:phosphatase PAP2 family protein [Erysipelotrichaceae bacterium]